MDRTGVTPVAVIGMACRLPGGIDSPERLWEALLRGDDFVTEVPSHRWDVEEFYDPEPGVPGRTVCKWGAFLDDVADFDPEFFGITEREATEMDPQHRLLLQTSWEAMEHAGLTRDALTAVQTGVFVGLMHDDYLFMHADADTLSGPYGYMGNSFAMGSGRVSYAMGLSGPAMTVDTACSSGLSAIHLACQSLHDGESDIALAGGASVTLEPRKAASGSAIGMLSATGHCHAFDVNADGFVSGEGAVMLLLKRLPDAQRDGDRILAVIRGTAANQDGRTVNIVTPSRPAQVAAYRAALAAGGVDPTTIGMVEAHGTGTPIGDPIEYASLAEVYGTTGPCALASVKTNYGHTQSAAGALGMMKAVLAVQHGLIPQNLHFTKLPEKFAEIETNLFVPQANTPWPRGDESTPRRAAVSSYGFSGTNVHAVIEQAPEPQAPKTVEPDGATALQGALIFPISASSEDGLHQTATRLADWVGAQEDLDIRDLAYTLARRRTPRAVRTTVLADSRAQLVEALREVARGEVPHSPATGHDDKGPVWVFSGQGSQWAEMGKDLLANEPVFAAKVAEIEPLIGAESGFSVTEALTAPEKVTGIDRVQPTIFAMQVALAAAMKSYGAHPGAVIGHSLGESAASVVAGALSLEDGVKVICRRSKLMTRISGAGAMASVELPAEEVITQLVAHGVSDVVVAVVASPQSTVIGGDTQSVRALVAAWEERGVMAREVAVDVASHSPQVDPILDDLYEVLADIEPLEPGVPYYSATSFDPREEPYCDAGYWADNLRHTVRFAAAVQAALEDDFRVFTELSPHPLLTNAVDQTARSLDKSAAALASMRREQPLPHGLRSLLGDLFAAGAALDWAVLYPDGRLLDAPLPTWSQRSLFLATSGLDSVARRSALVPAHPLMGVHVRLPEEPERHVWQGEVGIDALPWLADHQIRNADVLPGAAYCEMALVAARTVLGDAAEVRDLRFEQSLPLDKQTPVGITATFQGPDVVDFTVESNREGRYEGQASAVLHAADPADQPTALNLSELLANHPRPVDGDDIRKWMDKRGHRLGPAFAGLGGAHIAENAGNTVLAEVSLPGPLRPQQGTYGVVHPALLDACFQAVAAHPSVGSALNGGLLLPLSIRRLRAYGSARHARYCYATVTACGAGGVEADLDIVDENGNVLMTVRGLQMGTGASPDSERDRVLGERLLTIEWQPRELPDTTVTEPGNWLLVTTSDAADLTATALTDALKVHDAQATTLFWPFAGDHAAHAEQLRAQLQEGAFHGVVLITAPQQNAVNESGDRGGQYVEHVVRIARELPELLGSPPRLYALTRNAQRVLTEDQPNLEQGGLRGLLRVISSENPQLKVSYIDLPNDLGDRGAEHVARQLLQNTGEDETAWRNDEWYTARMLPTPLQPEERRSTVVDHADAGMRLQIRIPGDLETLEFTAFDRVPPGPSEIEVAVSASSVNFADVLGTFGRYQTFDGHLPDLGLDFGGVVTAVGSEVTDLKVGDHVAGLSTNGCWANFVTCDARLAAAVPDGISDAEAAAATTAYATAWYGLTDLARIRSGDKVLIHSATGGVGQAAIAIARTAGAQIFATAGSPERREKLRAMGIENVYDSRSSEFAEQIRQDTDGYGVDIVLNSLTGAAQQAGIKLLALGGRFIEIGKRDIYSNTRLELFPFRQNLAFYGVDLALMAESHPAQVHELLNTVYQQISDGVLPAPEVTHYPMADAATAIRVMGAAEHTGKLVLDVPHVGRSSVVMPPEQAPVFRGDGAYIITGGLGGLGLFLAEKMASAGAGRIVLTSRSQPNQKALETIELVRSIGSDVVVECGDIAEAGTAEKLVATATATGLPLRGVLHAAAVVEDATLPNITEELIRRDWAPKVHGAWNLHEALQDMEAGQPLDWFCSFSSAAALVGSPGQGAYAAANSWLDAFTHWRRAQGLPATSIAWGPWGEIGRATSFAEAAGDAIQPEEGAYAFEALLRHNRAYTGYAPIIGSPWLNAFAQHSPFAEAFKATVKHGGNSKFLSELDKLPQEEWPARLRRMVSEQIGLILRRTIDVDKMLTEYGLDSLSSQELRTRIESETGVRITATNINTTVRSLADLLYEELAGEAVAPA